MGPRTQTAAFPTVPPTRASADRPCSSRPKTVRTVRTQESGGILANGRTRMTATAGAQPATQAFVCASMQETSCWTHYAGAAEHADIVVELRRDIRAVLRSSRRRHRDERAPGPARRRRGSAVERVATRPPAHRALARLPARAARRPARSMRHADRQVSPRCLSRHERPLSAVTSVHVSQGQRFGGTSLRADDPDPNTRQERDAADSTDQGHLDT